MFLHYAMTPSITAFIRDAHAESGFGPLVPIPDGVVVEGRHEPVDAHSGEVSFVVEPLLQAAEETLGRGVIRRAALGAHGTRQPVLPAYPDPPGPPAVEAPIVVDGRRPARPSTSCTPAGASCWPDARSDSYRPPKRRACRHSGR